MAILNPTRLTPTLSQLKSLLTSTLDDRKAEDMQIIDLRGKADFADYMIVASGTSTRHVIALANSLVQTLHDAGVDHVPMEGIEAGEWVLVDAGDIIIHLFHPEVRTRYNLEKMWAVTIPSPALVQSSEVFA